MKEKEMERMKKMGIVEEELIRRLQDMVKISSVNPPGKEEEMVTYIKDYFREIPCEIKTHSLSPGREVIMARILAKEQKKPGLIFTGHMDVVPVSLEEKKKWKYPPFSGKIIEGKLYGRGSTDMKSGLCAAMMAFGKVAKQVHQGRDLPQDVYFVATLDEEDFMAGSKAVWNDEFIQGGREVIVCEPTSLKLATGSKGRTYGNLKITGHTAHGSEFRPSSNAILIAKEIMLEMDHAFFLKDGKSFWQPLAISAGVEPCVVPDDCQLKIDARLAPGDSTEMIWQEMDQVVERVRKKIGHFQIEKEIIDRREPWITSKENEIFQDLEKIYYENGWDFKTMIFPGTTDGTIFRRGNRKVFILGPGNLALAHRENEYVEIEEVYRAYRLYWNLMMRNTVI